MWIISEVFTEVRKIIYGLDMINSSVKVFNLINLFSDF